MPRLMERRDFLGAALALFTWTVLPEPVRESIFVWDDVTPPLWFSVSPEPDWMGAAMKRYMNAQLYAPRGVTLTHIGEATQQEYVQWFSEQEPA
ncbi:MAG: hypothetical protein KAJ42_14340 [Gemmatimonadetes bacterium]|nr:hypothetical protein [Gemmatimonadota bacterium]